MEQVAPPLQESTGRSRPWSGASLLNAFAERAEGDKRTTFAVSMIPGLDPFADAGGEIFGAIEFNDLIYVVTSDQIVSISRAGDMTVQASLPTTATGTVRMAANISQIGMVIGNTGYIYQGGGVTAVPDLPSVTDIAFIDGYFAWTQAGTGFFTVTDINNGLSYDAADVANAEGAPDNLVGLINDHRELQLYGTKTIEIWYNSGDADFPFSRQGNAFIERGCFDRRSIVKMDNSVYFYGDDRIFYRLEGYSPIRVSTHAIEYALRNCSYVEGMTYSEEGHKFYIVNTDVGCYSLDLATGLWHRRKSWGRVDWRANHVVSIWGTNIFLEKGGSKLWRSSFDIYSEDGERIEFEVGIPTIEARGRNWQTCYAFEALFETGVGNDDEPDPVVELSYSRDGGRSWSLGIERKLGRVGEYSTRAVWRKLCKFRQLNIKLRSTDPVRRFAMSYYADIR